MRIIPEWNPESTYQIEYPGHVVTEFVHRIPDDWQLVTKGELVGVKTGCGMTGKMEVVNVEDGYMQLVPLPFEVH